MNFLDWNDSKYEEFLVYLQSLKDEKYQKFHSKIICTTNLIGVRTNELKKIAKLISNGDYQTFIMLNKSNLYEPVMIEGFLYGNLKMPISSLLNYIDNYIKKIDNWAQVDLMVANLKIFNKKENQEIGFKYAKKLIRNKKNWIKRVGIIILLNYYLHDIYIDKTLELISKIKTDDYYVKMAISWLLATSYIKYKEKTLLYLVNQSDDFIYNKTISKVVDSRQVAKKEKDFLKSLRRKSKKGTKKVVKE